MTPKLNTSQSALEQLADLTQTLEKEKVELTPEVEEYVRNHVRAVQDKLQARQDVYENELEFIPKVKMWVSMPKEWREKYRSVGEMLKSEELLEANKRHISIKQWFDLLRIMELSGDGNFIDGTCIFPGGGKIKTKGSWDFRGYKNLTRLPDGLSVKWSLNLEGCTGLTELPEGLKVGTILDLINCSGLTKLPEGLSAETLDLKGCTGLTKLPEGLKVSKNLYLTEDLQEQVKKDAERLKKEGRIGGKIQYAK